ncbi:MFS transporter [Catellatospora sichuanensis]|uniref:MFS transporter n=1 Tax=Catellatospora sichuanensis TaxID=1969805 RepID=UPI001FECF145
MQPFPHRRSGTALVGSLLLTSIGGGLFLPLSIVYFTALTTVPLAELGILIGAANAITIPVPLFAGALADRVGARTLVIGALLLQAASFLAFVHVRQPAGIFIAAAVGATGVRFFWSTLFTFIADHADHTAVLKDVWYARANITRTVGIGTGGLITGAVLADGQDATYRAIAYAACICLTLAAASLAAYPRMPRPTAHGTGPAVGYRAVLADRPFLMLTAVNTVFAMSTLMLGLTLPTFIRTALHAPAWLASVVLVGNAIIIGVLGGPLTRRLARHRRTRLICLAAGLWTTWSLAFAGISGEHSVWSVPVLVAATVLFTTAEIIHAPASMAIAAACAPPATRGRYLALFQYSFVGAEIAAPVLFAGLFGLGHAMPFLALAVLNIIAFACTLRLEPHLPPRAVHEKAPQVIRQGIQVRV